MSTEQTLQHIDDTLDDWHGHSPDAARWAGGPTEGEWRPGELSRDDDDEEDCHLCQAGTIHLAEMCEPRIAPPDDSERAREWADEVNRQLAWPRRST